MLAKIIVHLRASLGVSLVVGSLLTLINEGKTLYTLGWSTALLAPTILNFMVPLAVSCYARLQCGRKTDLDPHSTKLTENS